MTFQELRDLYIDAQGGDVEAEEDFRAEASRLATRVNKQLERMKKSKLKSESSEIAKDYLRSKNRKTFSRRTQSASLADLMSDVEAMTMFQTSGGYSRADIKISNIYNWGSKVKIDFPDEKTAKEFSKFLSSKAWEEYKKEFYVREENGGKGELLDIAQQISAGKKASEFVEAFERYKGKELDIIELQQGEWFSENY